MARSPGRRLNGLAAAALLAAAGGALFVPGGTPSTGGAGDSSIRAWTPPVSSQALSSPVPAVPGLGETGRQYGGADGPRETGEAESGAPRPAREQPTAESPRGIPTASRRAGSGFPANPPTGPPTLQDVS